MGAGGVTANKIAVGDQKRTLGRHPSGLRCARPEQQWLASQDSPWHVLSTDVLRASTQVANTNQSGFPGQWNLGLYGLLGNDTSNTFKDWNAVFIMYCDGSSFTSYREAPLNGLHYRGRKILDGVISELLLTHRMDAASEVILSGTSAGGMATYVHANLFRSVLPVSATMAAVPDAGYW